MITTRDLIARHLEQVKVLNQIETVVALTAVPRKLVTLIHNRSVVMGEAEAVASEIEASFNNDLWGAVLMAEYTRQTRTFLPSNEFRFKCPIFGSETKITHCFEIRDRWAKGQRPEVRQGCQACLSSNKCPVGHVLKDMQLGRESEPYYSATPVVGKLDPKILNRIASIRTMEQTFNQYPMPPAQRDAVLKANTTFAVSETELEAMSGAAPKVRWNEQARPKAEPAVVDDVVAAAQRGDMAAAITKAAA